MAVRVQPGASRHHAHRRPARAPGNDLRRVEYQAAVRLLIGGRGRDLARRAGGGKPARHRHRTLRRVPQDPGPHHSRFPSRQPALLRAAHAVRGGVDVGHVRFHVLERFNSYARREDVDLSQLLHAGVWAAPRAWGYPSDRAGVGAELSGQASAIWPGGFVVLRGAANGVYAPEVGGLDSGRVSGGVTVASQNLRGQTLILHAEAGALKRPKPGAEFDLWVLQKGPRVFGIHQLTGSRMAWLALEDRILVRDELWGLVGLGIAPFFDYGGAWYADEPARLGGDVGLALRMGPTRSVHGDVAEFAVGYRFGQAWTGSRWAIAVRNGVAF